MLFTVEKKAKSVDLEKDVDIEAIKEKLSRRFGKDIDPAARISSRSSGTNPSTPKEDQPTTKQRLTAKFRRIKLPTLCGFRYHQTTSFCPKDKQE